MRSPRSSIRSCPLGGPRWWHRPCTARARPQAGGGQGPVAGLEDRQLHTLLARTPRCGPPRPSRLWFGRVDAHRVAPTASGVARPRGLVKACSRWRWRKLAATTATVSTSASLARAGTGSRCSGACITLSRIMKVVTMTSSSRRPHAVRLVAQRPLRCLTGAWRFSSCTT